MEAEATLGRGFAAAAAVGRGGEGDDICPRARRQRHGKHRVDSVMLQCVMASDSVRLSHRAGQDCCGKSPDNACRRAQDSDNDIFSHWAHRWLSISLRAREERETEWPVKQNLDTPENDAQLACKPRLSSPWL